MKKLTHKKSEFSDGQTQDTGNNTSGMTQTLTKKKEKGTVPSAVGKIRQSVSSGGSNQVQKNNLAQTANDSKKTKKMKSKNVQIHTPASNSILSMN